MMEALQIIVCIHLTQSDREYLVRARGNFSIEKKNEMLKGIIIDGEKHQFTML